MADAGSLRIDLSEAIVEEVQRVLREKFQWSPEALAEARAQMNEVGHKVTPDRPIDAVPDDPTDNRILECALAGASDFVVTGDKHLLRLGQFAGMKIVKPAEFIEVQGSQGRGR